MSHKATDWAFDQPELHGDMMPNEWAVLLVLADCHNPVKGCYPSQQFIRRKTNLSDRSVRDQLTSLRNRKLINWDIVRENGRRGVNRYKLAFEKDFLPANPAGSSTGKTEHVLPANLDTFYRQNLPDNLVREEPVIEPKREGAREDFEKALRAWPSGAVDDRKSAQEAWNALSGEERIIAAAEIHRYVTTNKAVGRSFLCAFATYLVERRWEGLPPRPVRKAAPAGEDKLAAGRVQRLGRRLSCSLIRISSPIGSARRKRRVRSHDRAPSLRRDRGRVHDVRLDSAADEAQAGATRSVLFGRMQAPVEAAMVGGLAREAPTLVMRLVPPAA